MSAAPSKTYPTSSTIEKAYVRGLREGRAQTARKLEEKRAAYNELVVRLKTAKGELRRRSNAAGCSCGGYHAVNCPLYVNRFGGGHAC